MAILFDVPDEWNDRFPCKVPTPIDRDFLNRIVINYLGETVVGTFISSRPSVFVAQDEFTRSYATIDLSDEVWIVSNSIGETTSRPARCSAAHRMTSRSGDHETGWSLFSKLLDKALPSGTFVMPLVFRRHYLKGSDPALLDSLGSEELIYERVFFLSHKVCRGRPKQLVIRSEKSGEDTKYTLMVESETVGTVRWVRATGRASGDVRDIKAAMAR
jgi:hypothetical protein